MGNAPTGGKRRNSNEYGPVNRESQVIGQTTGAAAIPAQKKLIIKPTQDVYDFDPISRILAEADTANITERLNDNINDAQIAHVDVNQTIPTVFRWEGGGKEVFLSGTFNNWKSKIPMVRSKHNFYTIVELPEGEHQYKYIVDGSWKIDQKQRVTSGQNVTQNNVLSVKTSDFDVLEALKDDIANSKSANPQSQSSVSSKTPQISIPISSNKDSDGERDGLSNSPPGSYTQHVPTQQKVCDLMMTLSSSGSGEKTTPPLLPPQLLQVILNKETGVHCDPNLLPQPNHVMINHMYALSIKDGVIVLSSIARYRQKFVSTVMYKPI